MTLTPVKAIRAKCLDCCCGQRGEVRQCPVTACPLFPYRLGKRPAPPDGVDGRSSQKVDGYLADIDEVSTNGGIDQCEN